MAAAEPWKGCLNLAEIEAAGAAAMAPGPRAYYEGGAGDEVSLRDNRAAFERWRIVPRMFVPNVPRDASVEILGRRWPQPFAIAPMALQLADQYRVEMAAVEHAGQIGRAHV